jgi:hypothetical protein
MYGSIYSKISYMYKKNVGQYYQVLRKKLINAGLSIRHGTRYFYLPKMVFWPIIVA